LRYNLGCPQCGAPVELGEREQIIDCPYCRVRHILIFRDHPVCRLGKASTNDPEDDSTILVPYWHFKGLAYALNGPGIKHRILDLSSQAGTFPGLPPSLGLRPQTMPLQFIHPETTAGFLPVGVSKQRLLQLVGSRLLGLGSSRRNALLQSFVGDLVQLVYTPFQITNNRVFDGITGKEIRNATAEDLFKGAVRFKEDSPIFLPALCPHCGWDLEGDNQSLCQACTHCDRLWVSIRGGLHAMQYAYCGQADDKHVWLPFWQIQVNNPDEAMRSRGDMICLANLPRVATTADRKAPLEFMIPAFKLNPFLLLRLARQTTVYGFKGTRGRNLTDDFFPCTLPLTEAWQVISPLLFDLAHDKGEMRKILIRSGLRMTKCTILFIPFKRQGLELIQEDMGVSIPANAVEFGRKL
jgi:DNA-directed RNA polymerase subunit RPC12/RpoP